MGKGKTLRLQVDSYDQPQEGHSRQNPNLRTYSRGDEFEARSDAEYDRLVEIGAALDPAEDLKRRKAAADAEADRLRAEADRLQEQAEAQIAAVEGSAGGDLSDLTKPELQKLAADRGLDLPKKATKDELRSALESAGVEPGGEGEVQTAPPVPETPEEASAAATGTEPDPNAETPGE